jgi:Na+-transporting methylmalonyl-CoA/oxaloacetate decarboxylase gamma subunit
LLPLLLPLLVVLALLLLLIVFISLVGAFAVVISGGHSLVVLTYEPKENYSNQNIS